MHDVKRRSTLDVGSENQVQDEVKNVDDVLTPASSFVCTAVFVDGWDFFDGDLNESRPSQELWRGRFV
ncbi:Ell-associated factor Eaf [Trichinella spiralis]|uniref:Ell-associated factor Eaf n=1 Tax=Trichinella spiralis TaxID=6334 RepID=A0ABR3KYK6_TRISP